MEKSLPQSTQAEQGVLGSILIDPDAIVEVHGLLSPDDFYRDAHREIYTAIQTLYLKREGADLITLSEQLERDGKLEACGGIGYLAELPGSVPTSVHAAKYARIVAKKAAHRRRIDAAGRIAALSYEETDDAQIVSTQLLDAVDHRNHGSDFTSLSDVLLDCMNDFDEMKSQPGSLVGVPTGYHGLDVATGGFQKSDLIILAARPAVGKTTLAQNIAYNAMLDYDMRVAFFSLEMTKKQLAYRFIAMDSRIDSQRLRLGQIADEYGEWDAISSSIGKLSDGRLWIDDTAGIDIDVLCSRAKRLAHKQGIDIIMVDYIGLVHATVNGKRPDDLKKEVAEVSGKLKQLAKDLNAPVLALCQMNRSIETRVSGVPQLSDLRDSGSLEQDADIVLFLHRNDEHPGTTDVIIAKHRNGPVTNVTLGFEGRHTRFFNIDQNGREVQ